MKTYLISILSNFKQGGHICLAGDDPQNQDYKLKMINMKLNLSLLAFCWHQYLFEC